jgi:hypothetical protein
LVHRLSPSGLIVGGSESSIKGQIVLGPNAKSDHHD